MTRRGHCVAISSQALPDTCFSRSSAPGPSFYLRVLPGSFDPGNLIYLLPGPEHLEEPAVEQHGLHKVGVVRLAVSILMKMIEDYLWLLNVWIWVESLNDIGTNCLYNCISSIHLKIGLFSHITNLEHKALIAHVCLGTVKNKRKCIL